MAVIYLGSPAIDRPGSWAGETLICKESPASTDAYITDVEIWAANQLGGCIVVTFYNTGGNNFTARDSHYIGTVSVGSKRTYSGLTLLAHPGDYIGIWYTSGAISTNTSGYQGVWSLVGDHTSGSATFNLSDDNAISLRGIATTYVPTVTSQAVSNIGTITATGNGNITFGHATKRGVCWNTTGSPTVADNISEEEGSFGTGAFTSSMTGLSEGQKYYVKAYAYNPNGYGYGSEVEFTTYTVTPIDTFIATKRTTSVYIKRLPQMQVYNGKMYYIWEEEDSNEYSQIWTAVLDGDNFTATKKTTSAYQKEWPQLQIVNDKIYYVWGEFDSGAEYQIWTAIMDIDGSNFVATQRTTGGLSKVQPQLHIVGGYIYYVWRDTDGYGYQIATGKMNINGTGWSDAIRTSYTGTEIPTGAHLYVSGNYIYYVFYMYIFGDYYQIYTAKMSTGGSGWTVTKKTTSAYQKALPKLQVVGNYIYYVYLDYSGTYRDVWTAIMNISGAGWTATQRTASAYHKEHPQLQVIDNKIHYTYLEVQGVSPNPRQIITAVMDIDGSNWVATQRTTTTYLRQNPQLDTFEYVWKEYDSSGYHQIWTGTLLKPPTDVQATDGAYTDKVTITWTKSTGATAYQVYRDSVALGWLGDVATYNDTGADTPTITHGSITASDGSSTAYVALSNTGASTSNGTTHIYKVKARNVNEEESKDSETDTGYRGISALTYQWYKSAGDSDASYSSIGGATASTYNDTGAPAGSVPGTPTGLTATDGVHIDKVALTWANVAGVDGEGRYYKCYHTAEGATPGYTGANRGYRVAYTSTDTQVKRDTTELGAIGSLVTSYNDTGADAPTITPGTASASDGAYVAYVTLSLSGQSANNGTTHNYYVRTYDVAGWGNWCSTNTGYRGVGSLTYQWQKSAGDSNAGYSNISGATTSSHNDIYAPLNGDGRYYKCVENATGATQQISTVNRGYKKDITGGEGEYSNPIVPIIPITIIEEPEYPLIPTYPPWDVNLPEIPPWVYWDFPELPPLPPWVLPDLSPWEFPDYPSMSFINDFYYRKPYTRRDLDELRRKCIIFNKNSVELALVLRHNTNVLREYFNELSDNIAGRDEFNRFKDLIPTQHLKELYLDSLELNNFKDIINSFIVNSADNNMNVNHNFNLIQEGLSDYETGTDDAYFREINTNVKIVIEDNPDVDRLKKKIDELNNESTTNFTTIMHNLKIVRARLL